MKDVLLIAMGFGSYDENEQENNEVQTAEDMDNETEKELRDNAEHDGDVEFNMQDTQSAIDRLSEIQDDEEDESEN